VTQRAEHNELDHLARLKQAMMRPEFYPESPSEIELRETHLSCVFLAGEYAYKFKKPVRFTFIDCHTLALRYALCQNEVTLNRRLAPDVYLGVFAVSEKDGRLTMSESESKKFDPGAFEYLVKMRRLPEQLTLKALIAAGQVDGDLMRKLARHLAAFHKTAGTEKAQQYGSASAVLQTVTTNLTECLNLVGYTVGANDLASIEKFFRDFVLSHKEFLDGRVRLGEVREGHGDLRLDHVYVHKDTFSIIDCVEFSEQLRYADVASEIAFLAMELDLTGKEELADELAESYSVETQDEGFKLLVNFYKCHRACVRGKVESLKSLEEEVAWDERDAARARARAAFKLAVRYAQRGSPVIVVICGLSGTGKSTVAAALGMRTGFTVLRSDAIRKQVAGLQPEARMPTAYGTGIYSADFDRVTYEAMLRSARALLKSGRGVILDATFKRRADRQKVSAMSSEIGVPVLFVECTAPLAEIRKRLAAREQSLHEVSDANWGIFIKQQAEFEPLTEMACENHIVVDTTSGLQQVLVAIEHALERLYATAPRSS